MTKYERRELSHNWEDIRPLLKDSTQITYEIIRPVLLFGGSPKERSEETGISKRVLSELKSHLGIESSFCYSSPNMKREREAKIYELSVLCCIHTQKASEENRAWLCNLRLLRMPTDF